MGRGGQRIGKLGEDAVCEYLVERGHAVLDRNWRWSHLEIDIVTLAEDGIHFVEVKSRTAPVQASPELSAGQAKLHRIAEAARHYLVEKDDSMLGDLEAHIDVAAVTFDGGKTCIEYFPDACIPLIYGR